MKPEFIVGAYASLPQGRPSQELYYMLLGEQSWVRGTELPFPGDLANEDDRHWLAEHLPAHWHTNSVTAIPGTMRRMNEDPWFGLASPQEAGRRDAIGFFEDLRRAVADVARVRGAQDIAYIELHSAPRRVADAERMEESLRLLASWDWSGARLVIEHCDRYIDGQEPEKGFLRLDDEIALCKELGIGLTVNWGRSAVEGRSARTALEHVRRCADADALTGLMFSGAGPEETIYGYPWIDGHLPMNPDEPTSLMDADAIAECMHAANTQKRPIAYVGAKVCVPRDATLDERVRYLSHIHEAVEQ